MRAVECRNPVFFYTFVTILLFSLYVIYCMRTHLMGGDHLEDVGIDGDNIKES
jgi:hypothetical protein